MMPAAGIVFFQPVIGFHPPLPSTAFLGSLMPSGEPENAAGVSAS
ncbi:unnamed protein product [Staurois parvus]|uniref:Uncharacterized protein n=1 Tax=Staurois parvus TaxID=386267 RepID=A0ABN9H260_9NEOB|nr:unnamed protein product [Staurois parvus]